jgi:hypothetical protein
MTKLKEKQFYCVKEKKRITSCSDNIAVIDLKNKKALTGKVPALVTECSNCDTRLYKFIPRDVRSHMIDKYGKVCK